VQLLEINTDYYNFAIVAEVRKIICELATQHANLYACKEPGLSFPYMHYVGTSKALYGPTKPTVQATFARKNEMGKMGNGYGLGYDCE
jgi:hypothetical protein